VAEFWTLLREMDKRGQLPAEIFALEIGVGTGGRAALWLDRFRALDEARATGYYPRLRFLLGDYAMPTLDRALAAVDAHRDLVSVIAMDALNPLKTLAFLRYKILNIHLTNVYDNLAVDELVRRDGRLYVVDVRARLPPRRRRGWPRTSVSPRMPCPALSRCCSTSGPRRSVIALAAPHSGARSGTALRLDERLRALPSLAEAPLPPGLRASSTRRSPRHRAGRRALPGLVGRSAELRQHPSAPAPAGYLQVQDIFVTSMGEYRMGFRGPGKLDGSVVNWVNGPLLRAVAARRATTCTSRPSTTDRARAPRRCTRPNASEESHADHRRLSAAIRCPGWLERAKNDFLRRRVTRHDLDEMHDGHHQGRIKDQETAGVDVADRW
jgi:hypothetical protein